MFKTRAQILESLKEKAAMGRPIIGGGAGTGISAKCEEAGGIDLIVIYNSGKYRMAGRGSLSGLLAYGNANDVVKEMGAEILPVVRSTPVLAGVNGTDPFMLLNPFLRELREMGFSGVQNFPTVGLIDGTFRANLEETGMSYALEVDMIAAAHQLDLLTTPYVFDVDQARLMTNAGADVIVAHMGLTSGGTIGAQTVKSLDACVSQVQAIIDTCKELRPDVIVLCHGGPIAQPPHVQHMLDHCRNLDGFYGATSLERLPTEIAITQQIKEFSQLRFPRSARTDAA